MTHKLNFLSRWGSKSYKLGAFGWTMIILLLSMMPNQDLPKTFLDEILGLDKIGHFTFYCIFFFLWALVAREKYSIRKSMIISLFLSIGFGFMMEICQKILSFDRQFDLLDALANTLGGIFGVLLFVRYEKFFPIFASSNHRGNSQV